MALQTRRLACNLLVWVSSPDFSSNLYRNGKKKEEYKDTVTTEKIVDFINKNSAKSSTEITCPKLREKIKEQKEESLKATPVYFGEFKGEVFDSFKAACLKSGAYNCYHAKNECAYNI